LTGFLLDKAGNARLVQILPLRCSQNGVCQPFIKHWSIRLASLKLRASWGLKSGLKNACYHFFIANDKRDYGKFG
jgi:hypothetical protein